MAKRGKPLSAAHKRAISEGLKAFHKGGKKRKIDHNAIADRAKKLAAQRLQREEKAKRHETLRAGAIRRLWNSNP